MENILHMTCRSSFRHVSEYPGSCDVPGGGDIFCNSTISKAINSIIVFNLMCRGDFTCNFALRCQQMQLKVS